MHQHEAEDAGTAARLGSLLIKRVKSFLSGLSGGVTMVEKWPLLAAVAFYVATRVSGGTMPHIMYRVKLLLLLGSYAWTRMMLSSLECLYDSDQKEMQRGQKSRLTMRFDNEGFIPITRLEATGILPGHKDEPVRNEWKVASAVPGLASRMVTRDAQFQQHGRYRLGPIDIRVADPFGWFEGRKSLYGDRYVTVYPRIMPIRGGQLPLRRPFGSLRTRIRSFADPSNLADIRPLRPGDNPRHIHWPTSARIGEPYVREFELTASGEVHVMIDLSQRRTLRDRAGRTREMSTGAFESSEARETGFDLAAGLAANCLRNDLAVGLIARGKTNQSLDPGKGPARLRPILRSLAYSESDCPVPTDQLLQQLGHSLGSGSTLLLVTGALTPSMSSHLTSMVQMGMGVSVFVVTDGATAADHQFASRNRLIGCWVVPAGARYFHLDATLTERQHGGRSRQTI